jgi:hypothetical protein
MKFDITNRWTGSVIFSAEIECAEDAPVSLKLGLAVKVAVKARANLAGAYLAGANLAGANLAGANLADANLADANLAGANLADANLADAKQLGKVKWDADGVIKTTIPPIQMFGATWPVMVFDGHIKIGCQAHTTAEWKAFTDEQIARMDGASARRFWKQWKTAILALAKAHQSKVKAEPMEPETPAEAAE